jgi:hypothetical protein
VRHALVNFGIERTLAVYNSSAVFGFEVPIAVCRRTVGTSNLAGFHAKSANSSPCRLIAQ